MMEWLGYQLEDFVPFGAEAYLNLIERSNAAYWPLPVLLWLVSAACVALQFHRKALWSALTSALMGALLWMSSGYGFLHRYFGELVWASTPFAMAFYVQGLLLSLCLFMGDREPDMKKPASVIGLFFCGLSLAWPMITSWIRSGGEQAEWAGLQPDPTALLGMGLALLVMNGWRRWLCCLIPVIWLGISLAIQQSIGLLHRL